MPCIYMEFMLPNHKSCQLMASQPIFFSISENETVVHICANEKIGFTEIRSDVLAHRNEFNQAVYIDNNLFGLSLQLNDTQIFESDIQSISVLPSMKVLWS